MLQQEEVGILSREENTLAITPSKKGVDLFLRVGLFLVHTDLELGNTGNLANVMCQFPAAFLL